MNCLVCGHEATSRYRLTSEDPEIQLSVHMHDRCVENIATHIPVRMRLQTALKNLGLDLGGIYVEAEQ